MRSNERRYEDMPTHEPMRPQDRYGYYSDDWRDNPVRQSRNDSTNKVKVQKDRRRCRKFKQAIDLQ